MDWIGFFTILVLLLLIAGWQVVKKRVSFADAMMAHMAVTLSFAFDMIICKQLKMYHYVSCKYGAVNSLLAGLLAFPAISIIFTSFLPKTKMKIGMYIGIWTVALTLLELYIAKPLDIILYDKWRILPWSPVVYIVSFILLLGYRKIILNHVKHGN